MAQQPDSLTSILESTINFFTESLRPFYFEVVTRINSANILDELILNDYRERARVLIIYNEGLDERINNIRDEINRNLNPEDKTALTDLDKLILNGKNALEGIKNIMEGLTTLMNLNAFFNQARRKKVNKNRRKGKKPHHI